MNQWRQYKPSDKSAVEAIFKRQAEKCGLKSECPDFLAAPIVMVMVHEVDGNILRAFTVEATAEVCAIADAPIPAKEIKAAVERAAVEMKVRGFSLVRAFVPSGLVGENKKGRPSAMRRFTKSIGFTEEKSFTGFYRWL